MEIRSETFRPAARAALGNRDLQQALARVQEGFVGKRRLLVDRFPDFEGLRDRGQHIKDHTLANLDWYLEAFEARVTEAGGVVHWAADQAEAQAIVTGICREAGARKVTKGKTMAGEEVQLNEALEAAGFETIETDLGEYIIQLAQEPPSHIIAPAIHKTRQQISDLFNHHHHQGTLGEAMREVPELVDEARRILREQFLSADVGITGANCLVAETGSLFLVTNEGNGDLTHGLPPVHIAIAGIEKVVPTLDDANTLLRLLARSATGQEMTAYTTMVTGPRRAADTDGPEAFHIVLLDNGRTRMLGGHYRSMLRCIRCGACMNHCPVYSAIGGHAYGWVYPGPMGSVLTPLIQGLDRTRDLPNACTLNGRCQSVCPVRIPLPELLRELREEQYDQRLISRTARLGLAVWAWFARRPRVYATAARLGIGAMGRLGRRRGRFRWLPLAGGWTAARDFPAPARTTFQAAWRRQQESDHD